jgi:hypothetical protein
MKADWVQFTAASPFIGTQLRQWAIEHGQASEDEYAYINCYEGSMGNENLTREQVNQLAHFAQLIGTYLINRKGFLKEERPVFCIALRAVADCSLGMAPGSSTPANGASTALPTALNRFRAFDEILITGATGFLGISLLQPGGKRLPRHRPSAQCVIPACWLGDLALPGRCHRPCHWKPLPAVRCCDPCRSSVTGALALFKIRSTLKARYIVPPAWAGVRRFFSSAA